MIKFHWIFFKVEFLNTIYTAMYTVDHTSMKILSLFSCIWFYKLNSNESVKPVLHRNYSIEFILGCICACLLARVCVCVCASDMLNCVCVCQSDCSNWNYFHINRSCLSVKLLNVSKPSNVQYTSSIETDVNNVHRTIVVSKLTKNYSSDYMELHSFLKLTCATILYTLPLESLGAMKNGNWNWNMIDNEI